MIMNRQHPWLDLERAIRAVVGRLTRRTSEASDDAGAEKLNPYGVVFAEYRGTGTLAWKSGARSSCTFQAFQLRNGDVRVLCQTDIPLPFDTAEALTGETSDGRAVIASDLFKTNYLLPLSDHGAGLAYRAKVLDVSLDSSKRRARGDLRLQTLPSLPATC